MRVENESNKEYLERLFADGDKAIKNLRKIKQEIKRDGVTGFCKECGADCIENKPYCANQTKPK